MKKVISLFILAAFLPLSGFAKDIPSWKDWSPKFNVQDSDLSQFRSRLPKEAQEIWDRTSITTQKLAFAIMLGLKTVNNGQISDEGYYTAFKLANKAEAGFYLDKALRVLPN